MSSPEGSDSALAEAREAALRLLARREHSARELETKLLGKGWPGSDASQVISDLAADGLQSDRRFAESFARQRAGRHYGPRRILAELAQRGIDSGLAAEALESLEVDFAELAADFYRRKYGNADPDPDYRERARRSQALYRRGFESEHLRGLIRAV
ncbi:MAG: regulatory protein RecX [Wenzhouxiangellaceae bacterium]